MVKASKHQKEVLTILKNGGKLFHFEDCTFGLDDCDSNTLKFNRKTFEALYKLKAIAIIERPNLGTDIYGITKIGLELIMPSMESLQELDIKNIKRHGISNNDI
jgi:hypothetical protein